MVISDKADRRHQGHKACVALMRFDSMTPRANAS